MKNGRGENDEVLGTALARAIESQRVRETRFEDSRLGERMNRSGRGFPIWQLLGAAAVFVLALGIGSWVLRPGEVTPPAASPTAPGTTRPAPTATPPATALDRDRVYMARDQLPPVGIHVDGAGEGSDAAARIRARLGALATAQAPAGTVNVYSQPDIQTIRDQIQVTVDGDLATVDFTVPDDDWGVRGAAMTTALLQQLVYTISEEPGIRLVWITQNGGSPARIDQIVFDNPLTRNDVHGYSASDESGVVEADENRVAATLESSYSVDEVAPGLARVVVELTPTGDAPEGFWIPSFTLSMERNDESARPNLGKWVLSLAIPLGQADERDTEFVDRTPLRSITTAAGSGPDAALTYLIGLDDARPWRVSVLTDPIRIVVDIGGHPQAVAGGTTVYSPQPGDTVSRTFGVSGLARAFEANVTWRVKDSSQQVVASGFTTASIGTSPIFGTYQFEVRLGAAVTGNVTLEVLQESPRDGSDTDLVQIPLQIR